MKFLATIFSESDGSPSSMRVAMFMSLLFILVPHAWVQIERKEKIPLSESDVAALAVVLGAKVAQKFKEQQQPS